VDSQMKQQPAQVFRREGSLLRVHARWILVITLVAIASAVAVSSVMQKSVYTSDVGVLVAPRLTSNGTPLPLDMETELVVATSGTVTSGAEQRTGVPASQLRQRLSVTVPANTTVLMFRYSDATVADAQRRAQSLAEAYVAYRNASALGPDDGPGAAAAVGDRAAVLTRATTPTSATGPNYPVNILAGLVLGLMLGVGSALLRDRLDHRVRGPRDFTENTGLSVLAAADPSPEVGPTGSPEVVMLGAPESAAAEAYRYLRVKVVHALARPDGRTAFVLLTSARGDDGTTLTAANLAAALARAGKRVILVAGDLRSPTLPGLLAVDDRAGLTNVLLGEVSPGEVLHSTEVDGLWVLGSGTQTTSPGELMDEQGVRRLFGQLEELADVVVVDSPPVLAAAETLTLAGLVDAVILVAAADHTSRPDLVAAVAELRAGQGHLLGGVLYTGPLGEPVLPPEGEADEMTSGNPPWRTAVSGVLGNAGARQGGNGRHQYVRRGSGQ
jgi:succinoglycan biosynthesis transport protein ExoP